MPLEGNICILGVGAEKINFILQEWMKLELLQADRIILGPHKDTEWFCEKVVPHLQRYHLVKTIDVREKNRIRTILVLDKLL
jgi:tRNA A22 N-methylase